MAKGDYYFPLYYKRLLASTIGWTDAEFGTYLRLLIHQFDNGFIPEDLQKLSRISPGVKRNWPTLSDKFISIGDGKLINPVMDEIYHEIQGKKLKNSANGKKGGRPVKNRIETESKPNGYGLGFENETQTKAIPIINNKESIINNQRENTDTSGSEVKFPIERCLEIAMNDQKWIRENKPSPVEISEFMTMLTGTGEHEKNPADFKRHFYHWKKKGKVNNPGPSEAKLTLQELREMEYRQKQKELNAQ